MTLADWEYHDLDGARIANHGPLGTSLFPTRLKE